MYEIVMDAIDTLERLERCSSAAARGTEPHLQARLPELETDWDRYDPAIQASARGALALARRYRPRFASAHHFDWRWGS